MNFIGRACLVFFISLSCLYLYASKMQLGLNEALLKEFKNKKIGLYTNQTGVNQYHLPTLSRLASDKAYLLTTVFTPEHGLNGSWYAEEKVLEENKKLPIKIISLFGADNKPTKEMMGDIDVLLVDIQSIGIRPYTYVATLFQLMEVASDVDVDVVILDRPNPINGLLVDGPVNKKAFFSRFGYIQMPYVHGMTIGELAQYFNAEYQIGVKLTVVAMSGWKRFMRFTDTGLSWIPSSPNVPEPNTPIFAATTGAIGELGLVNIGVGYTLPFKIAGAPWIDADVLADTLNKLDLPGVYFQPFYFKPFHGLYKGSECQGVLITITEYGKYKPFSVQYALLDSLKKLYPNIFYNKINNLSPEVEVQFNLVIGSDDLLKAMKNKNDMDLLRFASGDVTSRDGFLSKRNKYLIAEYE